METKKFRAWDADFKKMIYEFTRDGYSVDMQEGILEVGSCDGDGDYFALPLMQFTGLLDKNGKEIYEGDIILSFEFCSEKFTVEFFMPYAGFRLCNKNNAYPMNYDQSNYKIIGNIYENPELI